MPTSNEWVEPETVLTAEGPDGPVTVYHVYKNDEIDNGPRTFWFTTDQLGGEDDNCFDVRDLDSVKKDREGRKEAVFNGQESAIEEALREAIRLGELESMNESDDVIGEETYEE